MSAFYPYEHAVFIVASAPHFTQSLMDLDTSLSFTLVFPQN